MRAANWSAVSSPRPWPTISFRHYSGEAVGRLPLAEWPTGRVMALMTLPPSRRVLGLFAKEPLPGLVKTRVAQSSSADWAARVATAFLHDLLGRLEPLAAQRFVVFSPATARPYFADLVGDRFALA